MEHILKGIELCYQNKRDFESSTSELEKAIQVRHKSFTIINFKKFKYGLLDIKCLLLIAVNKSESKEYSTSNDILIYIYNEYVKNTILDQFTVETNKILIKICLNISYNYHCLDRFDLVLQYADKGLELCSQKQTYYLMHNLYYRKGIAHLLLGDTEKKYMNYLVKAIHLMEIQNLNNLKEVYKKVTLDKYNIEI